MEIAYPFWALLSTYALIHGDSDLSAPDLHGPISYECVNYICQKEGWVADGGTCNWIPTARRFKEQCQGAPPVWAAQISPGRDFFAKGVEFLDSHVLWLEFQRDNCWPHQAGHYQAWHEEACRLRCGYQAMMTATSNHEYYVKYPSNRREVLKDALHYFGEEALFSGVYPPPAPLHFFRKVHP